jgi:hypothetical protein
MRVDQLHHFVNEASKEERTMKISVSCIILQIAIQAQFVCSFSIVSHLTFRSSRRQPTHLFSGSDGTPIASKRVVVVSPPGGVGEVTAVQAAQRGSSVRWFVVTPQQSSDDAISTAVVTLSQETLDRISTAGGSLQFAGATVPTLLSNDESSSAIPAVSTWCGAADALVCTLDGVDDSVAGKKRRSDEVDPTIEWKDAIKVAAFEAAKLIKGIRIAVLSTSDADDMGSTSSSENKETDAGILSKVGNLFGGNKANIPATLSEAMTSSSSSDDQFIKLRHGQIFGTPESSPDFSALVGGPRRIPELCEEYRMRTIRVDPTLTVAGNLMMGKTTRSSRHAVGEAAALMLLDQVPIPDAGMLDVCVSSQPGTDPFTLNDWVKEFQRVETVLSSGEAAELFSADFASVPNVERFADWIASKWAPTVLRTYDIAAIRTGARPVIAYRAGPGRTEIVWQQLVNFESVAVGRMVIQITENGMKATRGPGDAAKGYGTVSTKPLAGEDVLVRRLAEAASQAIEKGLADKAKAIIQTEAPKVVAVVPPIAAIPSPVAVTSETIPEPSQSSGPRVAGARRSTERVRKKSTEPTSDTASPRNDE